MENTIVNLFFMLLLLLFAILVTYLITTKKANKKISEYKSITDALLVSNAKLDELKSSISKATEEYQIINLETEDLQKLRLNASSLAAEVVKSNEDVAKLLLEKETLLTETLLNEKKLHELMAKLDLYTRIDEYVEVGHFEMPEYLFETSARYVEEIKRVRLKQKELIKDKIAVRYPPSTFILDNESQNQKILDGQVVLMLTAFNIESDFLIGKVRPSNFAKTIDRIEKLANKIEKSPATLYCGFNIEYIELKYEECRLQYQSALKKEEEQTEQKLIREQIREEQKAIKEYERAIAAAEKEEKLYRDLLKRAREELTKVTAEDRAATEIRIAQLEAQLAEAEAKEARAKSMAEQTRKGHVYVISNIGSFGDKIYKIGLTRRLEPMDRVKELGDASVPFTFDVHAMIYVDDAPSLESALHREFTNLRVNAVNYRKEFFNVDLETIKSTVERIAGQKVEFKMTAIAEEYYESRRLNGGKINTSS